MDYKKKLLFREAIKINFLDKWDVLTKKNKVLCIITKKIIYILYRNKIII